MFLFKKYYPKNCIIIVGSCHGFHGVFQADVVYLFCFFSSSILFLLFIPIILATWVFRYCSFLQSRVKLKKYIYKY